MVAPDAAWDRFYRYLAASGVLGVLLISTCWGGYGAGLATASSGLAMVIVAGLSCCFDRDACMGKGACAGCFCGCKDCADLMPLFHVRNVMVVCGLVALVAAFPVLFASIAILATPEDCEAGTCHSMKAPDRCRACWDRKWTFHPWRRWEHGLSELCWADRVNKQQTWSENDYSWWCSPGGDELDGGTFEVRGPRNSQECRAVCDCFRGEYEPSCGPEPAIFGVPALLNALFAFGFVAALACSCTAAGRIIDESGGPLVLEAARAAPWAVPAVQVVGHPVRSPVPGAVPESEGNEVGAAK